MTAKLFQSATVEFSEQQLSDESTAASAAKEWADQVWDRLDIMERTELERIKAEAPQFGRRGKCFGRRNAVKAEARATRSYPQTGYARFVAKPLAAAGTR